MPRVLCVLTVLALARGLPLAPPQTSSHAVTSPDSRVILVVETKPSGRLTWSSTMNGAPVIESSALGIVLDGTDLGDGAEIQKAERYRVDETYPWRGVHSTAVNRANGSRFTVRHLATNTTYVLDARAADDGVAFRISVAGAGRHVPDAAAGFHLPAGSVVWSHGLRDHYEAVYERRTVEAIADGDWAAPPVTFKLPRDAGYAAITEADLRNYPGMALQADGRGGFRERLAHSHPPGYPYLLRFKEDNAQRLSVPAAFDGGITTPWRIVIMGRDLNTLVNSDLVSNLCPPPDARLFPDGIRTSWLKPGRAVWRYLDGGESTPAGIKEFSRLAGELGFEYQVVEGQWARWSEAELRDVVEFSKARAVGLLVWRHRNTLEDPGARRTLFASLQKAGVAGVKVDFLDHEAKEVIDLYRAILRDAAEFHLIVNFHGANKPTGEPRTWPNEMTREGIYGLEHRRNEAWWATFNATFPFVRMLAGHADYTPVVFGERRRETSWAHQIASAVILTSPLLVYGGHPASLLANPASDIIKSVPSVWDDTIVLPQAQIGEMAIFARRSGDRWFVAAMNGPGAKTVKLDLSFLGAAKYRATIARDTLPDPGDIEIETREVRRGGPLEIAMRSAGGFVIRLSPELEFEP
jgi:alpha-glucosidase